MAYPTDPATTIVVDDFYYQNRVQTFFKDYETLAFISSNVLPYITAKEVMWYVANNYQNSTNFQSNARAGIDPIFKSNLSGSYGIQIPPTTQNIVGNAQFFFAAVGKVQEVPNSNLQCSSYIFTASTNNAGVGVFQATVLDNPEASRYADSIELTLSVSSNVGIDTSPIKSQFFWS